MSRAASLLDYSIYEGLPTDKTRAELKQIGAKARSTMSKFKSELRKEQNLLKKNFNVLTEKYPEVRSAFEKDKEMVISRVNAIGDKLKAKTTKLKATKHMTEDFELVDMNDVMNEFGSCLNEASLATLEALRSVHILDSGLVKQLKSIIAGLLIIIFAVTLNTIFLIIFSVLTANPSLGMALTAILIAPITEELAKKVAVDVLSSEVPGFVFALLEFNQYLSQIIPAAAAITNPVTSALYLAVAILGRVYAMEMHTTTTRWYMQDKKKFGFIRKETLREGMRMHRLWNFLATLVPIFVALAGLGSVILSSAISLAVIVSVSSIIKKVLDGELKRVNSAWARVQVPSPAPA